MQAQSDHHHETRRGPADERAVRELFEKLLEEEIGEMRLGLEEAAERLVLPRLFLIESEHELMLREAELTWLRGLVGEIRAGTLGGIVGWRSFHSRPDTANAERATEGGP